MDRKNIEIVLLSGFLGSGKSTLLKQLIQIERNNGRKIGVLMNELGDTSIDSSIIPSETPLKEMLNGCICCTIQGELSLQLNTLLTEHELDVIYIEATGAAHPLEVIDSCTHPLIAGKVSIKSVITVINALQWHEGKMSNKLKKLIRAQAEFADIVLINKIDQLPENALSLIKNSVKELNQQALILPVNYSKIDPSILYTSDNERNKPAHSHINDSHVHDHLHLKTITVSIKQPIERVQFIQFLKHLKGHLFRVKGFIKLQETPGVFLFNYAYGDPVFERYTIQKITKQVLVFIGEGLDERKIYKGIRQLE
ncbi:GTP-binding protein [Salipaludibacillus sp. CUR1]|uniref:CobW family GTP-binding protein n=1 Tax=Salipaludibacillus sp. CUR1 TaxID=2820003 RepID=UPI001E356D08|nr:GTP-binding protein [Salipaludibacillus sp. CUR1]MCE7793780.1 GTP-binding protein [Salipaludibacillus sp. CUR1]